MNTKSGPQPGAERTITLRRDGNGALRFSGERIGSATRQGIRWFGPGEEEKSYEISAKLFKTTGGKFVAGVEVYNRTDEQYECRDGFMAHSLEELADKMKPKTEGSREARSWFDDDILGELFEHTELADRFVIDVDKTE